MRWGTALLLLALVSCTGDRAGVSQTFPVCPESVIEWGGQPSEELRALGVWWAAEGPEAIAFDVQVGTCGVGWLPSAELLATVPADAWEPVLNQPTLPVQTVVYADMDGSGGYTPAVDYVWGRGEGTALVFVPGVLREPSTMSPAFLPEPLSAVARKNLEPLLEREVFRPWSPRLEVSPGRMDCGRIVDV
ncbi:MAG: hypothetical protein KC613_25425, partial [Myxococcales bacterium]|nr:hypothetical protein [Myxococcales bacterium]